MYRTRFISPCSEFGGAMTASEARMREESHPIGLGWRHRGEPGLVDSNSHPWAVAGIPRIHPVYPASLYKNKRFVTVR